MRRIRTLRSAWIVLLIALICAGNAAAAVHASINRNRVAVGETVLLDIGSDGNAEPDFTPLDTDFDVLGRSNSSQTSIVNGRTTSLQTWTIALSPRHGGALRIPALAIGGEHTDSIALNATDQPAPAAGNGASAFIENTLDDEHPYVQQPVMYTVRLYYAVTLLAARLDVLASDGTGLRQIGDDAQSTTMIGGRRYNVIERHYLFTPERSGSLTLPAPSFHGRAVGEGFDGMIDGTAVGARGQPKTLQVRARPAQAFEPWLPARTIVLDVDSPSAPLHAGEPFTLTVKLTGEGVTAAQLPDPQLPQIPGAQIYPEASSFQDSMRDGRLLATRTRRFAIVPNATGNLQIPPIVQSWWDVGNDRAAQTRAAVPTLRVLPGAALIQQADPASAAGDAISTGAMSWWKNLRVWHAVALLLAMGWIATAWWAWRRLRRTTGAMIDQNPFAARNNPSNSPPRGPTLTRALALGELDAITLSLLDAAADPHAQHLSDVVQRLADPAQCAAVKMLDAARWGGSDPAPALHALRSAFAQPPRWRGHRGMDCSADVLPPLYPQPA